MSNPRSATGPLEGVGVLVTRAAGQEAGLVSALRALGADPHHVPAIAIRAVERPPGLTEALDRIGAFDGLVFTSANGVKLFLGHLRARGLEAAAAPAALCVGPRTARAWTRAGGRCAELPEEFTGQALAETLGTDPSGRSYLVLRPREVRTDVASLLRARGALVQEAVLYETVPDPSGREALGELLARGAIQVLTFTSPSSVAGTVELAGGVEPLRDLVCLCIGPTTAAAAREAGFARVAHPREHTVEGMLGILPDLLAGNRERR